MFKKKNEKQPFATVHSLSLVAGCLPSWWLDTPLCHYGKRSLTGRGRWEPAGQEQQLFWGRVVLLKLFHLYKFHWSLRIFFYRYKFHWSLPKDHISSQH